MSRNYSGTPGEGPLQITLPSDTDNSIARSAALALMALADRDQYQKDRALPTWHFTTVTGAITAGGEVWETLATIALPSLPTGLYHYVFGVTCQFATTDVSYPAFVRLRTQTGGDIVGNPGVWSPSLGRTAMHNAVGMYPFTCVMLEFNPTPGTYLKFEARTFPDAMAVAAVEADMIHIFAMVLAQ